MKKIIVASDSFKGSVSSREVADAVERGVLKVFPTCEVVKLLVADGGEGTAEALVSNLHGTYVSADVHDPLMRPIKARYGVTDSGTTAIIEMAAASGLTLLTTSERNPERTTTFGTGELIRDALLRGCRHLLVGIGGSATNDGGVGMLQALGYRFYDANGAYLDPFNGEEDNLLQKIASIDDSAAMAELRETTVQVACDVTNPFYGANGAARIFARQKGADNDMIERLDSYMKSFSALVLNRYGIDMQSIRGAGAAGGVGGALAAFLGAELRPGIDLILESADFDKVVSDADLVITGEGRLDAQTAMGKAPYGVLKAAGRSGVPVIAIAGLVEDSDVLNALGFKGVYSIHKEQVPLEQAMNRDYTLMNIERLIVEIL